MSRSNKRTAKRRPRKRRKFLNPLPGGQGVGDGISRTTLSKTGKSGVPQAMNVKLKYTDSISVTSGTANAFTFGLNSMYDPNISGIGHQPMGYDQWTAFYDKYRVNACKVKLTVVNGYNPLSSTQPLYIGIWPDYQYSGSALNLTKLLEQPNVSYDFVTAELGGGSDSIKSIEFYTSCANYFGLTKAQYSAEESYSAPVTANPTKPAYVCIQTSGFSSGATTNYWVIISFTFYATFYEPKILPSS